MAEPQEPGSQGREETRDPHNPPNVMLRRETRRAALMSYLGPLVVLFVVVGIALVYWANREPVQQADTEVDREIATTGSTEGGGDPQPDFDDTREEIDSRGSLGENPSATRNDPGDVIASVKEAAAAPPGRTVSLKNIEVENVQNDLAWIHDGNNRLAVTVPENASRITEGGHVDIDGVTEADPSGGIRIRASRLHAR
jgi:hypothetical protein